MKPSLAVAAVAAIAATLLVPSAGSAASGAGESYPVPPAGVFTIHGRGFGHGRGMSQWGAYGAAKVAQLSANQILHFYYPHTTLSTRSTTRQIRVLLTAARFTGGTAPAGGFVAVAPAAGLAVTAADGKPTVLPTTGGTATAPITGWRLVAAKTTLTLQGQWSNAWHPVIKKLASPVTLTDTAAELPMVEPTGGATTKTIRYRGEVDVEVQAGNVEPVDLVPVDLYLRSVVPSEMPPTWAAAALAAQAVAARTYAWHGLAHPKAGWFDVFGDTRDQGYGGVGSETSHTNHAIHATAGEVVVDATGQPILAQYSSSNGGWTVSGAVNYLPARHDPYDGALPSTSHAWTVTVSAAKIAAAYPSVGVVSRLSITSRDGHGAWGGRITEITVVGTKKSLSVPGADFAVALGLRSPWFRPTPPPGPPTKLTATAAGRTVTANWQAPAAAPGAAAVTGYRVKITPAGPSVKVAASTLAATLSQAPVGTDTVTVTAVSAAGANPGAVTTVVVKAGH